jgi:pectate lyase
MLERALLAGAILVTSASSAGATNAFPGAAGYGRASQGGRGGAIVYVTTTADSGPGSLRACVEASGPRNCVFRTGGVIKLATALAITSARSDISILGQTAPGGGITLTIGPTDPVGANTPLYAKGANDVVIRHIRVRNQLPNTVPHNSSFLSEDSTRVYVDHFSGAWATDQNLSDYAGSTDVTVAYSIWGEGLRSHSKCALLGSALTPPGPQNISIWRNLCTSNNDRNPDHKHEVGSCVEFINNLVYNFVAVGAEIFDKYGKTPISIVNNTWKAGPATNAATNAIQYQNQTGAGAAIYAIGNKVYGRPGKTVALYGPNTEVQLVQRPPCPLGVPRADTGAAYTIVRSQAGAFPRDSVDTAYVNQVGTIAAAGTGPSVIPSSPGAVPAVAPGTPYADTDVDGMPDSMEATYGGVVGTFDPWADPDADGWSTFDEVMDALHQQRLLGNYPG